MPQKWLRACLFLPVFCLAAANLATGQAPAKLGCTALDNGQRAPASFRVLRGSDPIAGGACGQDVEVPAGEYALVVTLDGVLGVSEQRHSVRARAGAAARVQASFETGELLVEVVRGERRSVGLVRLLNATAELARLSAGVISRVVAGSYAIEVEARGEQRRVDGVVIARGERRVLRVEFSVSERAN